MGVWGWAHSIARTLVAIISLLTHMINVLPFLSYLAGSKSVLTTDALESFQYLVQISKLFPRPVCGIMGNVGGVGDEI